MYLHLLLLHLLEEAKVLGDHFFHERQQAIRSHDGWSLRSTIIGVGIQQVLSRRGATENYCCSLSSLQRSIVCTFVGAFSRVDAGEERLVCNDLAMLMFCARYASAVG
jgi:hypothetical protein